MTQDEIIRMFHEAGKSAGWKPGIGNQLVINYLTRFAALVAAHEREACLACYSPDDTATDWADKIRARNIDSVDVFPKLVEKTPESIKDCGGAQHHRYAGTFSV